MANSYLEFSAELGPLTPEEEAWLQVQLSLVWVYGEKTYNAQSLPESYADMATPDWHGYWLFHGKPDVEYPDELGFQFEIISDDDPEPDGNPRLWVYAEEWGSVEQVGELIQAFLKRFRPKDSWGMTYAVTCSKPRPDHFSGGYLFVTADGYRIVDAAGQLEEEREHFAQEPVAEITRRYVLYDFDADELASAATYINREDAVAAASELDDVMVIAFELLTELPTEEQEPEKSEEGR